MLENYTDYFITADVHLNKNRPDLTANFFKLLDELSVYEKPCLIINGDFLDFWFENGKYDLSDEYPMFVELRNYSEKIDMYLIKGNRDFLADRRFEKLTNIKILGDEYILNQGSRRYLITHGDIFCTRDFTYKIWRIFSRSFIVRYLTLLIPEKKALQIIAWLRSFSSVKKLRKTALNMSIVLDEVKKKCVDNKCDTAICGHNHVQRNIFLLCNTNGLQKIRFIVLHKMHYWGAYYAHITKNNFTVRTIIRKKDFKDS